MQKQRRLFRCWWQSSWRATPAAVACEFLSLQCSAYRAEKSISSWAADLLFMAASFHATMCYVSFWIRSTLNAWVGSHLAPFFARRGSGSKMLVFSVDLTFCCCCGNVTSATTCSSCFPAFPCSATMAAPFFQPEDDGHILFSHYLSCTVFDGALCSFVGVVVVVVDNGIHHSRATWLNDVFLATVASFKRASRGQDRHTHHATWVQQKVKIASEATQLH